MQETQNLNAESNMKHKIKAIYALDSANRKITRKIAESAPASSLRDSANAESNAKNPSLRGARSEASATKQSKQNLVAQSAPETRPLRGAKNREKGCSSATADFLLEAEKRGTPPKSEKRLLLGIQLNSRGERERSVALFAKETSESNLKNGENLADSAIRAKNAESYTKSQNLKRDSSLRTSCYAQNDNFNLDGCFASLTKQGEAEVSLFNSANCQDLPLANLAMTKKIQKNAESSIHRILRNNAESAAISQNLIAESAPNSANLKAG
ncbi:hypothetical protein [Helicobacter sp. 23-1045]